MTGCPSVLTSFYCVILTLSHNSTTIITELHAYENNPHVLPPNPPNYVRITSELSPDHLIIERLGEGRAPISGTDAASETHATDKGRSVLWNKIYINGNFEPLMQQFV